MEDKRKNIIWRGMEGRYERGEWKERVEEMKRKGNKDKEE